jgi:hypothetical protein
MCGSGERERERGSEREQKETKRKWWRDPDLKKRLFEHLFPSL